MKIRTMEIEKIIKARSRTVQDFATSNGFPMKTIVNFTEKTGEDHTFTIFERIHFGERQRDFMNQTFIMCDFSKCEFNKCSFKNCIFISCDFSNCCFQNVTFFDCHFNDPNYFYEIYNQLNVFNRKNSSFWSCAFSLTVFQNCFMQEVLFLRTNFECVTVKKCRMRYEVFSECNFKTFCIDDSSFARAIFYKIIDFDLDFVNYANNIFDELTIFHFSKIPAGIPDKKVTPRSLSINRVAMIFREIGYTEQGWEYYYEGRKDEIRLLHGTQKYVAIMTDFLCGYGERPSHTFICIVLNILVFGLFYMVFGFAINERLINISEVQVVWPNITEIFKLYLHSVFFSITTFSTVGYGNYVPVGAISSTLAAIQMLMGVFLTALWTSCIFRKITR